MTELRKSLPIQDWPKSDRRTWERASRSGDIFDERGPAAHWSPKYAETVVFAYGRWLGYLQGHEPKALRQPFAQRVTMDAVRGYVGRLQSEISPVGVHVYLECLHAFLKVTAPGGEWRWLATLIDRLANIIVPKNKRPRIVDSRRLYALGIQLMERAEIQLRGEKASPAVMRDYRDGLMTSFLATRPLRRQNLAAIAIGQHLQIEGERFHLIFPASEMKNRRSLEFQLPSSLAPYMAFYLETVRPKFLNSETHAGLWASTKGCPLSTKGVYDRICVRTKEAFGHSINPHLFRDCAATTIAINDSEHVEIIKDVLGHTQVETAEKFYNQARSLEASRQFQDVVMALRRENTPRDGKIRRIGQ